MQILVGTSATLKNNNFSRKWDFIIHLWYRLARLILALVMSDYYLATINFSIKIQIL